MTTPATDAPPSRPTGDEERKLGLTLESWVREWASDPEVQERFGVRGSMAGVVTALIQEFVSGRLVPVDQAARPEADLESVSDFVISLLEAAGTQVDAEKLQQAIRIVAGLDPIAGRARLLVELPMEAQRNARHHQETPSGGAGVPHPTA